MNEDTKANLFNVDTWIRLLYMILFALLSVVGRVVIYTIALVQFVLVLITARPNVQLLELGQGVAKWALQAFLFLTYNSEEKPYPFSDWPETEVTVPEAVKEAPVADSGDRKAGQAASSSDDVPSFVAANTAQNEESDRDEPKA